MSDTTTQSVETSNNGEEQPSRKQSWFKRLFSNNSGEKIRETLEELIEEENEENGNGSTPSVQTHEITLLSNILKLRDLTAYDVMVPRADIIAVQSDISKSDLLKVFIETPRSRLPVHGETLDHILGTVHIKDFLSQSNKKKFDLSKITRDVTIISPSMPVLDLLLQMQHTRNHMALVVDEFGGIDGLVTLGDVIEAITGEIDDMYDNETQPQLTKLNNNTLVADSRLELEELESELNTILLEGEEREDVDTVAGLILSLAGRVPAKGELIAHEESGVEFEVIKGDTRRIQQIKVHLISDKKTKKTS